MRAKKSTIMALFPGHFAGEVSFFFCVCVPIPQFIWKAPYTKGPIRKRNWLKVFAQGQPRGPRDWNHPIFFTPKKKFWAFSFFEEFSCSTISLKRQKFQQHFLDLLSSVCREFRAHLCTCEISVCSRLKFCKSVCVWLLWSAFSSLEKLLSIHGFPECPLRKG